MFASEVFGLRGAPDQLTQIIQRGQIDPWWAYGHARANHRIKHPPGDRNYDARRT